MDMAYVYAIADDIAYKLRSINPTVIVSAEQVIARCECVNQLLWYHHMICKGR